MRAVDLFAGAGGFSLGARWAGLDVVATVNHWEVAVATHAANHPHAAHRCQDLGLIDPRDLPAHEVLIASPACQGHSRARGVERPRHDAMRSTAWHVVEVAEVTRPQLIVVENVPELRQWVLYRHWRAALSTLGYAISETVLDASDCGVPQERRRLFVVCSRTRKPVMIPAPSCTRVPARAVVDFDDAPSTLVAGLVPRTQQRWNTAHRVHGDEFLLAYYGSESSDQGRSLDRPIGTLTTKDRYAFVRGDRLRMLSIEEQKAAMGFPRDYVLKGTRADQVKQLGNAVPPAMAAHVLNTAKGCL